MLNPVEIREASTQQLMDQMGKAELAEFGKAVLAILADSEDDKEARIKDLEYETRESAEMSLTTSYMQAHDVIIDNEAHCPTDIAAHNRRFFKSLEERGVHA